MPRLLDKSAVAELFGVSRRTIDNWAIAGAIPLPIKIGGTLRWRMADIEDFITEATPDKGETPNVKA